MCGAAGTGDDHPQAATVAIGGARNAGLLAVQILASGDAELQEQVVRFRQRLAAESRAKNRRLQKAPAGG
jgi:5-(carboxyamino)imidazole ribonucleotide mutase